MGGAVSWLLRRQRKCSHLAISLYSLSQKMALTQANSRDGTSVEPQLRWIVGCLSSLVGCLSKPASVFISCPTGLVVLFTFSSCSSTTFVAASCFTVEWIRGVLVAGSDVAAGTVPFGPWTAEAVEVVVVAAAALVVLVVVLMVVVVGSVAETGGSRTSVVAGGGTSPLSSSMTGGQDVSS